MTRHDIIRRSFTAFRAETANPPPLTLRGGAAVELYNEPKSYDRTQDEISNTYLERYTLLGLSYLDAQSWRHYLPWLMEYAFHQPNDETMVTMALLGTLRPPDHYPPRLTTLSPEQEAVVVEFLEELAFNDDVSSDQADAQQALEDCWWPGARYRPTSDELEAWRAKPMTYEWTGTQDYRILIPWSVAEARRRGSNRGRQSVQVWRGYFCYDVPTDIFINVSPLARDAKGTRHPPSISGRYHAQRTWRTVPVAGADQAQRIDGLIDGDSPVEHRWMSELVADAGNKRLSLTIRTWPRRDVQIEIERMVESLKIVTE